MKFVKIILIYIDKWDMAFENLFLSIWFYYIFFKTKPTTRKIAIYSNKFAKEKNQNKYGFRSMSEIKILVAKIEIVEIWLYYMEISVKGLPIIT